MKSIDIKQIALSFMSFVIRGAILAFIIMGIYRAGQKAYDFGFRIFTEQPMSAEPGRDVTLTVTSGQGEGDVATMLEEKGLIRDAILFRIQKKLSSYKGDVKPGSYTLNTCMNTDEMLEILIGSVADGDDDLSEDDEYREELDPTTDDLTGLETGGVLSEEGSYNEGAAFAEEEMPAGEDEYIGEGDEESAIEE